MFTLMQMHGSKLSKTSESITDHLNNTKQSLSIHFRQLASSETQISKKNIFSVTAKMHIFFIFFTLALK